MKNVVKKLIVRNVIEAAVLLFLLKYFSSFGKISFLSLIPIVFVLIVFVFDFFKIYKFNSSQNLEGLLRFQSKFLFYSFAWYFFPIFLSITLILKNLNGLKKEYLLITAFIYGALYLYNLSVSRKLKNNLI